MAIAVLFLLAAVALISSWLFRAQITRFYRRLQTWTNAERVLYEDVLKYLYNCEMEGESFAIRSLAGQLNVTVDRAAELLTKLQEQALVKVEKRSFFLSASGREYALHVIRAHRLWERYLADKTGVAEVDWHGRAEKLEHEISPEQADALWAQLGRPTHDPHGDPLPTSKGSVEAVEGLPLLNAEPELRARVVHVEDEPETIYARLVNHGIFPGMELQVLETELDKTRVLIEGSEKQLDALEAANITLEPIAAEDEPDFTSICRLSDLKLGESGKVALLSRASRGSERRRFMDLGILPGTLITAELKSPGGDPVAYRVRGALLALRREQAQHVLIDRAENGTL